MVPVFYHSGRSYFRSTEYLFVSPFWMDSYWLLSALPNISLYARRMQDFRVSRFWVTLLIIFNVFVPKIGFTLTVFASIIIGLVPEMRGPNR
ncbi:DUF805 domain-containing protein [Kordiimonas aquimaris]